MDKYITSLTNRVARSRGSAPSRANYSVSFAHRLQESSDKAASQKSSVASGSGVLVGVISRSHQTVSDLLLHHKELKNSTWDILSSDQNSNKDYTKLSLGTKVYYNSGDGSLSWSDISRPQSSAVPTSSPGLLPPGLTLGLPVAMVQESIAETPAAVGMELGVIGKETPTVSHLLKNHPTLQNETWNILLSDINKGKDFSSLSVGAVVRIDPVTHEISWQSSGGKVTETAVTSAAAEPVQAVATSTGSAAGGSAIPAVENQPTLLGRIDRSNPTVSHLLHKHPELGERLWAILGNSVNRGKPFGEIPSDTEIYLQPDSMEIVWGQIDGQRQTSAQAVASFPAPVNMQHHTGVAARNGAAADLTEAVQPFMGTPYREMNCYELLVKGLERLDIQYSGKGGLFSKLTHMAREKGLPANAFLTGEGIVKAAGSLVLSKNYPRTSNWKQEAEQLFKEMEPLLDKGQILSFSTQNRGHVGIISQQEREWTFINSGRLDNSLTANSPSHGVGEEVLKREIRNWFKLANSRGESLMVTLGALGQEKVVAALNIPVSGSNPRRI